MITLPTDVVEHLNAHCPARTDEALQPRFGISYNTWRKIERGEAIRGSVARRLIERARGEMAVSGPEGARSAASAR